MKDLYWNHNTAYHKYILNQIRKGERVLDVGCGDGLLVKKLSEKCRSAVGIEVDMQSAQRARKLLKDTPNATIYTESFENFECTDTFDTVIFVASLHHMNEEKAIRKAKSLLTPNGRIIIVGLAKAEGFTDVLFDLLRVIPAKLGSLIHGEKAGGDIGVPTAPPTLSLKEIRKTASAELPKAKIRRGLYYRYLLIWKKA